MARCMCVSCLCGREPVLSRSAGAAAAALLVLGAQMCPAAAQQSAHSSAAKAEAELFGARRGDSTEAELVFPPDKVGR